MALGSRVVQFLRRWLRVEPTCSRCLAKLRTEVERAVRCCEDVSACEERRKTIPALRFQDAKPGSPEYENFKDQAFWS